MSNPSDQGLYFNAEDVGPVTVVHLTEPELRHPSMANELGEQLRALVEQHSRTRLVIDFSKVHYMSSTAFATIVSLGRKLDSAKGHLALFGLQPDVAFGAKIIGLERIAPIVETEQEAIDAVSG